MGVLVWVFWRDWKGCDRKGGFGLLGEAATGEQHKASVF